MAKNMERCSASSVLGKSKQIRGDLRTHLRVEMYTKAKAQGGGQHRLVARD